MGNLYEKCNLVLWQLYVHINSVEVDMMLM